MGQTTTDLPANATSTELEPAADLAQSSCLPDSLRGPDPVEFAFENAASVTEPEVEVTAQGNTGKDPEPTADDEQPVSKQAPGSVTLTSDEVYELNRFLATSKYSLLDFEHLKPVFEKLKTPTGRGGWWGLGLLDRL